MRLKPAPERTGQTHLLRPQARTHSAARLKWMAKTWILDTETKGTGAHVVPLEQALRRPSSEKELAVVELGRPPRAPESAEPPPALTFKVVDVRSSRVLGEGLGVRATVELLEGTGSVVDIRIYVWAPLKERWRLLTLGEQKALWAFRGQNAPDAGAVAVG